MRSAIIGLVGLIFGVLGGALGALGYSHYLELQELARHQDEVAKLNAALAKSGEEAKQAKTENEALSAQVEQDHKSIDDFKKQLASAPAALAPSAPANPMASPAMMGMMKAHFAQQREERLQMLKSRLHLTPEQEAAVKAALDQEGKNAEDLAAKFMAGEKVDMKAAADLRSMKSVDQTLDSILAPEQKTAYTQMKTDEKNSAAEMSASVQMNQISPMLQLNDSQKDQVESALYQVQLQTQDADWIKNNVGDSSSNPVAIMTAQAKAKEDALAKILTPDQLATYHQQAQSQLQMQQTMIQKFMPQPGGTAAAAAPAPTAPASAPGP